MTSITQTITALPAAPTRDDPANFSARGDALMTALPAMVTQINAANAQLNVVAGEVNAAAAAAAASQSTTATAATAATVSQTAAATSATNAANIAAVVANANPNLTGTSTTSLAISTGSKTLTIETGKVFVAGQVVRVFNSTTGYMDCVISSYVSGTGVLICTPLAVVGSGTFTAWTVSMAPPLADSAFAFFLS